MLLRAGARRGAPPEAGQPGTVTYGLNLQAWCVFLMVMHHVPGRAVRGHHRVDDREPGPRTGGCTRCSPAPRRRSRAANKLIRALIILARVVCGDETPIRVGPGPKSAKKKYLHVACTSLLTYYFLGDRSTCPRSRRSSPATCTAPCIVHDRYQNYVRHEAHCYIAC